MTILLVDDNRDAVDMLKMIFETDGFSVATAYDGAQAVQSALAAPPDVVVMDLGMPGIDGYEAMRRIRAATAGAGGAMMAIALTGWNQGDTAQKAREAGFDHHLVKPVEYHKLMALIGKTS